MKGSIEVISYKEQPLYRIAVEGVLRCIVKGLHCICVVSVSDACWWQLDYSLCSWIYVSSFDQTVPRFVDVKLILLGYCLQV